MSNWKDRARVVSEEELQNSPLEETKPSWKDRARVIEDAPVETPKEPKFSKTGSALQGVAQGATFGFADEIVGVAEEMEVRNLHKRLKSLGNSLRVSSARARE